MNEPSSSPNTRKVVIACAAIAAAFIAVAVLAWTVTSSSDGSGPSTPAPARTADDGDAGTPERTAGNTPLPADPAGEAPEEGTVFVPAPSTTTIDPSNPTGTPLVENPSSTIPVPMPEATGPAAPQPADPTVPCPPEVPCNGSKDPIRASGPATSVPAPSEFTVGP